jgi:peptide chain release factor subunit 3
MTEEQWNFIFKYYPEHGATPYTMMVWLYGQAYASEEQYKKPTMGGEAVGGEDEEEENSHEMGFGKSQQTNKKQNKQNQDAIKEAQAKKLAELKEKAQPGKTDAEKEESKIMRVYKDREVNMAPEGMVEVDTTREPISMVFIGHVDAGKSTICGNLMYMMGVVDARTIEKYKQEAKEKGRDSWWLAYVMDVSDDEKAKGKTVEVGRATFDTPSKKYTIFDAPGHKNYVPNMIMGAAMADVAGLVISARKGEFEAGFEKDGQTREHAQLAKSLGVQKLVVIVNKMDECKWAKTRWDEIQAGLDPFLRKTGYSADDVVYIPIAGLTGENIQTKTDKCNWYSGPCLLDVLDQVKLEERFPNGPLRIPILDKMKDKDLIIHGKVENGTVRLGDKMALMPSGQFA